MLYFEFVGDNLFSKDLSLFLTVSAPTSVVCDLLKDGFLRLLCLAFDFLVGVKLVFFIMFIIPFKLTLSDCKEGACDASIL